jgi:hypothetical protein
MLSTATTIIASSGGPGTYSAQIVFVSAAQAKYLRVGDVLKDKNDNEYSISDHSGLPGDFASGGTLTVTFITNDVVPATFSSFGDSSVYTPDQVDIRPRTKSSGIISSASVLSGANYTYNVEAGWSTPDGIQVGDFIQDSSGKIYVIQVINSGTNFDVVESVLEGQSPTPGSGGLYSPTENSDLFLGDPLTDEARTVTRNRDNFFIDKKLKELEDSITSGSNNSTRDPLTNNTGSTILKTTPVGVDINGEAALIDVAIDSTVDKLVGLYAADCLDGATEDVVTNGLLTDVGNIGAVGDRIFLSKAGGLTNSPPEEGVNGFVSGDAVVKIGVLKKNRSNPTLKDLEVDIDVIIMSL